MVTHNCIYECNNQKCVSFPFKPFRGIICAKHLLEIYGLEATMTRSITASDNLFCGPYLSVPRNVSFKRNCIIFPTLTSVDRYIYGQGATSANDMEMFINPELDIYCKKLINNDNYSIQDANLYRFEIIRNIFEQTNSDIKLSFDASKSKYDLQCVVQNRLNGLENVIKNLPLYKYVNNNAKLVNVLNTTDKMTFSPFEVFIIYCCYLDNMRFQMREEVHPHTLNFNCAFVPSVGIVATNDIYHGQPLVLAGDMVVTQEYLSSKCARVPKRMEEGKLTRNDLPGSDYRSIYNSPINTLCD